MKEEFHAESINGTTVYKKLYNWNTLTANAWLPSLSELAGTTGDPADWSGCYYSAMQGLNTSNNYYTDAQGGVQFTYFKQFNVSGGGEKIWDACKQEITWLRSTHCGGDRHAWAVLNTETMDATAASRTTLSRAVHPAVL